MRDYLTKFKNDFNDAFINTLDYKQIKERVILPSVSQKKKIMSLKYRFATLLLIFLILGGVFLMVATNRVIYRNREETEVNLNEVDEAVVWAEYVFIGRVNKKLYTKQYDGSGYHMPYTYYSLSNIEYLKGEGEATGRILFYGGYDFLNNLIVFEENDVLPEPGEYHLFIVRKTNSSSTNVRAENDSFYIFNNSQSHLLRGYIPSKSFKEQSLTNQKLIDQYLKAIQE